jgi:iron complex outermembrane receptor protein
LITASAGTSANALRGLYFGYGGAVHTFDYGSFTFPAFTRAAGSSRRASPRGSWQVNDSGTASG